MKIAAYLAALMFSLTLMSSSCKKEEPLPSGELYPSYLGKWMNDSTYKNGFKNTVTPQLNFEFQNIKAIITAKNDATMPEEFNWHKSGSVILTNVKSGSAKYYSVISEPTNNKLVLEWLWLGDPYIYYLSK